MEENADSYKEYGHHLVVDQVWCANGEKNRTNMTNATGE
jgi:hypothetical protein